MLLHIPAWITVTYKRPIHSDHRQKKICNNLYVFFSSFFSFSHSQSSVATAPIPAKSAWAHPNQHQQRLLHALNPQPHPHQFSQLTQTRLVIRPFFPVFFIFSSSVPGSAVTFGSIDEVYHLCTNILLARSRPPENVKTFGSVPVTGSSHVNGQASMSSRPPVVLPMASISTAVDIKKDVSKSLVSTFLKSSVRHELQNDRWREREIGCRLGWKPDLC